MKKRYSIMVRESGADHETELCQVDNNPNAMVACARTKTFVGKARVPRYENIRVIDNFENAPAE